MSISNRLINDLKISDVLTFLAVHRCGSISGAARELMVTPSQVSKSVARLEDLVGVKLLSRSPQGVALLDDGLRVVPQFEQMLAITRQLNPGAPTTRRVLSIAAPSYLAAAVLPAVVDSEPSFRIRILELAPAQLRAHLSSGNFDIALSLGELPLHPSWESRRIGRVDKALFVSPSVAARLGPPPVSVGALGELSFISPIYLTDTGFLPVDDDCPIARRERIVGHETMTFGLALALAARTDQVVFGPVLGAIDFLRAGTLVKIEVEGWTLAEDVVLAYNTAHITAGEQRALICALERAIAETAPFLSSAD